MQPLVVLDNVHKSFGSPKGGETVAVKGVTLSIGAGEFVSLIGPSGCGKTTTLGMIAGLVEPSGGAIRINDRPPLEVRKAHELGMVFQDATLLPWRTVRSNVAFLCEVAGSLDEKAWRRIDHNIDLVGLSHVRDHYPHQLSGGMRQRAAIARALSLDPLLLLMDEPFGALDEFTRARMNDELLRIWDEEQKTVIFVTHNIGEAVYMSDRVIAMGSRPGRIVSDIKIDLPRPRRREQRYTSAFTDLVVDLQRLLEADGAEVSDV